MKNNKLLNINIIAIIFIFIVFNNPLKAFEYKNLNYLEFLYGSGTIPEYNNKYSNASYMLDLTTFNDFIFDNFSITSTIYFSGYTESYSRTYNHVVPEGNNLEFSELALNTFLTKNNILTIGLISFKHGSLSEYSKIGLEQSDSLYTLYYITLPGIFYTYHGSNNWKIQVGYTKRSKYNISKQNEYEHTVPGSDMSFLFLSKNYLNNNLKFKFNSSISNIVYNKLNGTTSASLGYLYLAGLGISYDNPDYSIYGILAGSKTDFDGTNLTSDGQPLIIPPGFNNPLCNGASFTDEGSRYGYSIFLGIKKNILRSKIKKRYLLWHGIFS
jgi:hypothetical protein